MFDHLTRSSVRRRDTSLIRVRVVTAAVAASALGSSGAVAWALAPAAPEHQAVAPPARTVPRSPATRSVPRTLAPRPAVKAAPRPAVKPAPLPAAAPPAPVVSSGGS